MGIVTTEPTVLDRLREQRNARTDEWATVNTKRDGERDLFKTRTLSDEFKALTDEQRTAEIQAYTDAETAFKADSDQRSADLEQRDDEISRREDIERRQGEAADASKTTLSITKEPMLYRADNQRGDEGLSYYRDLAMVHGPGITLRTGGTRDQAQARLIRHATEMDVEMPARQKAQEERARKQLAEAETEFLSRQNARLADPKVDRLLSEMRQHGVMPYQPFEQRVTPNSTQGYGGYFIPPLWLEDDFIPGLRAHLVAAGLLRQMDVPARTNSINVPKLSTLTTVGYQQANNAGLVSQDWTDTYVQANVKTIGGYSDVAIQLLEQSPNGIVDEVITTDLMAAFNKFLDAEVIAGDGTNAGSLNGGHLKGFYPYTNWTTNNTTWTVSTPAPYKHAEMMACMASQVAGTRFDASNFKIVMNGRRWFFYSSGLDGNNRPLGETDAGGRFNIQAAVQDGLQAEGLVGTLPFLANAPVYIDDNIGITDTTGGGSNQDYAIAGLFDDAWLFRSPVRTDVFREVESASLGVRFRLYSYAAMLLRYGQSFSVATGSGFSAPVGVNASSLAF